MRIGIDLMGSDSSPHILFNAVLLAAEKLDKSNVFVVFATPRIVDEIQREKKTSIDPHRIIFQIVAEEVLMGDDPLLAVRRKRGSSIAKGIRHLKKGKIQAFVSAGNTGALVASASISLPTLPGIKRPALLAVLPTQKGSCAVIDVGGTVTTKSTYLLQLARLATSYQRHCKGIESPAVGLLNIGSESKKGTQELRLAHQALLQEPGMRFVGNIEARDIFQGNVDVIVTDGFTGNVLIKTTEGASLFILDCVKDLLSAENLKNLQKRFNYQEHPGAILCGIDGVIIKCHGNASASSMYHCIISAYDIVKSNLIDHLKSELL